MSLENFSFAKTPEYDSLPTDFKELMDSYLKSLLEKSPQLPEYLDKLRNDIQRSPANLHVLTDEQIAAIVAGSLATANVEIAKSTSKKKAGGLGNALAGLDI